MNDEEILTIIMELERIELKQQLNKKYNWLASLLVYEGENWSQEGNHRWTACRKRWDNWNEENYQLDEWSVSNNCQDASERERREAKIRQDIEFVEMKIHWSLNILIGCKVSQFYNVVKVSVERRKQKKKKLLSCNKWNSPVKESNSNN